MQASRRGVSIDEIELTVREAVAAGTHTPNREHGRFDARRLFDYGRLWRGRVYPRKLVWVIFTLDNDTATVITVIARYGRWDRAN